MIKISSANIFLNENNTPCSQDYGDVYFSVVNGAQETDYVFIAGNELMDKWLAHREPSFCIAETGFGTGLNFFRTVQWFTLFRQQHPSHPLINLIFISTEKHPLNKADASAVIEQWQDQDLLSPLNPSDSGINTILDEWLTHYPIALAGLHRRHFCVSSNDTTAAITLDIHYGDATTSFSNIQKSPQGLIDAWFLDGFAPSKNNSMWTTELYSELAQLSKNGASFATFTAAGAVKRGLQAVGFEVKKCKGFGRKREMLIGNFDIQTRLVDLHSPNMLTNCQHNELPSRSKKLDKNQAPYFLRSGLSSYQNGDEITIVGNGIAGALLALKLTQRKKPVRLIWQGEMPSDCASGNPIGGFYPQLNAQNNAASQIQLHSFLYAHAFYSELYKQQPFEHAWCGALQVAFNENTQTRLQKLNDSALWPNSVAQIVSAEQASTIANIDIPYTCLHMPNAGWIAPPSLVKSCLAIAQESGFLAIQNETQLLKYECIERNKIRLQLEAKGAVSGHVQETKSLVLALGSSLSAFTKDTIPLRLTRGQVEMLSTKDAKEQPYGFSDLHTLLCHKGYFTPAVDGFHAMGSTYIKNDEQCDVRDIDTQANFAMHTQSMYKANWQPALIQAKDQRENFARAAIRCSSPDHLPVVGAMPNALQFDELADLYKALPLTHYPVPSNDQNVFVLGGLGSRGLTTAPLMAEVLVSQMLGEAMPLTKDLLDALQTNRFLVRALIRRMPLQ